MSEPARVAIGAVRPNEIALRSVNRESEDYQGMVHSMRRIGQVGTISVRQRQQGDDTWYEIIDGLHRYQAMLDAGIGWVNVQIHDLSDDQILETQIMASVHKIETRPFEYTQQLKRILARNPLMTMQQLATKLGKSRTWLAARLSLNSIKDQRIRDLINEGSLCLTNAYAMAKLPAVEQTLFMDRALIQKPDEFVPQVHVRVKELRRQARRGRLEREAMRDEQRKAKATHRATEAAYANAMTMPSKAAIERNLKLKGNAEDIKDELAKLKTFFDAALNKKMEKSAYDLLHGPVVDYKMIRPKGTSINTKHFVETANAPIQRRGWDNVTVDGRIAYCRGDVLVYSINGYTGKKWAIKHPVLVSLHNESFEDAETAMQAVEAFLCT